MTSFKGHLRQHNRVIQEDDSMFRHLLAGARKDAAEFTEKEWESYKKKHPEADPKKHRITQPGEGKDDDKKTPKQKGDDREKLLKDRDEQRIKRLPSELRNIGEPADVSDLPEDLQKEIKEYSLSVVGDDAVQAVEIARQVRKGIESAADVCKMSPSVCVDNMGLTRDKMPQITDDSIKDMLGAMDEKEFDELAKKVEKDGLAQAIQDPKKQKNWLKRAKGVAAVQAGADPESEEDVFTGFIQTLEDRGTKTKEEKIPVGKLKATQSEIEAAKVFGMADAHLKGKFDTIGDSVVVSRDGHILDGHHRWAAIMTIDPKRKMNVKVVDKDMSELLDDAADHPGVFQANIAGTPLDEGSQKKYKEKAKSKKSKSASFTGTTLRKDLIRLAHAKPEYRDIILPILRADNVQRRIAAIKRAHRPVLFRDGLNSKSVKGGMGSMQYMIDPGSNKSKFYEMLIEPTAGGFMLKRRWGRLTDNLSTGRVDKKDAAFGTLAEAQREMAKVFGSKGRKGYVDAFGAGHKDPGNGKKLKQGEYPVGLGAAGFGWGGQEAAACSPYLKRLRDSVRAYQDTLPRGNYDDSPTADWRMELKGEMVAAKAILGKLENSTMASKIQGYLRNINRRLNGSPMDVRKPVLTLLRYLDKQLALC